jgi:vancomycin resistance protein YoaR
MQGGSRTVPVSLISGPARLADAEALDLGIKEEIGRFATSYACCLPRVTNIKTVAAVVNGIVVRPGETFSLNQVVGRRDASTGFTGGLTTTVVDGTAGSDVAGISQFATTLFNAVIRAGLEDVKHTPHEVYMPQYPLGLEAMISYPGPDLRWRNDSPYGVLVQAVASDTSLTVTLWSTKRYDVEVSAPVRTKVVRAGAQVGSGPSCVPVRGQAGFKVEVVRVLKQRGKVLERQPFTVVYRPQAQITCPATG